MSEIFQGQARALLSQADSHRAADNLATHRAALAAQLSYAQEAIAVPHQVHSENVEKAVPGHIHERTDGLVTADDSVILSLQVADCAPIYFLDPQTGVRALVHAGWRGAAAGIVSVALEKMAVAGAERSRLLVAIGPCIEAACYEVGEEVVTWFDTTTFEKNSNGRYQFDLRKALVGQLGVGGVPPENIVVSPICSRCDSRCHSYRRDGKQAGRMVAFFGGKGP